MESWKDEGGDLLREGVSAWFTVEDAEGKIEEREDGKLTRREEEEEKMKVTFFVDGNLGDDGFRDLVVESVVWFVWIHFGNDDDDGDTLADRMLVTWTREELEGKTEEVNDGRKDFGRGGKIAFRELVGRRASRDLTSAFSYEKRFETE